MANDLVGYSRAGDAFHYRWAARRCLHLIAPNTSLEYLTVEGSDETGKAGEYVIDLAEYHEINGEKRIDYYQLKHSTTQVADPFTISDLKETFEGFGKRFKQHLGTQNEFRFIILTNRLISEDFKNNVADIASGNTVGKVFQQTISKYTGLQGKELQTFCSLVEFQRVAENYFDQKSELRKEIAQLIAGSVDNAQVDTVIAMVADKVLPDARHKIVKEDILQRFGFDNELQLFPAPSIWEKDTEILVREQYRSIKKTILEQNGPFIIHASGGVGKSVLCRWLTKDLANGSQAIAFDCFGAGGYRNRSTSRHSHRIALVQIVNELAAQGLCTRLLSLNDPEETIMRAYLVRLNEAITALKRVNPAAQLLILIDAADNAEMAALEFNQSCFAHEILRESHPVDVKLILLCRTERMDLLNPATHVAKLPLLPFTSEETQLNLQKHYPSATSLDGHEFHRLTSGNPRVQANSLQNNVATVTELLELLGPATITVEELIKQQLQQGIDRLKDTFPAQMQLDVETICTGLASLPPHIPLPILAAAAGVKPDHIKSFVADIGRSLWLSDDSVQFRDEPTETWFRETYAASAISYQQYIQKLEPLAESSTYVAEALPMLYLQAKYYERLIKLALSDDLLPRNNPIDERNVRVYRLKFAFQAALKLKNFDDAVRLALRAGEEVAGDRRQLYLLKNNIDLLALLQDQQKVQQMAYRRSFESQWPGAENIYSASALSFIPAFKGEARGYIRSARNWMDLYFEQYRENNRKKQDHERVENEVTQEDFVELGIAMLNVGGSKDCFGMLATLQPRASVAGIARSIVRRLLDHARYAEINELLHRSARIPQFYVAIVDELLAAGQIPLSDDHESVLSQLSHRRTRIKVTSYYYLNRDEEIGAILSFLESCVRSALSPDTIKRVLRHYVSPQISSGDLKMLSHGPRDNFLRSLAIRSALDDAYEIDIDSLITDKKKVKGGTYRENEEVKEVKEVILGLYPWFKLRTMSLTGKFFALTDEARLAAQASQGATSGRYRDYDFIPGKLVALRIAVLAFSQTATVDEVNMFYEAHIKNAKDYNLNQKLSLARIAFRCEHLFPVKSIVEQETLEAIGSYSEDGPEEISDRYVDLSRAVIVDSFADAAVYFEEAVKIVSKFGDEIVSRWESLVALGKEAATLTTAEGEIAYRFIRCAELVGKNTREKYWDREDALNTCIQLSPPVGIAALSRWHDRHVGYFDSLLQSALSELLKQSAIDPAVSWALNKLRPTAYDVDLVSMHLDAPFKNPKLKQQLFDDAAATFSRQGYLNQFCLEMEGTAKRHLLLVPQFLQQIIRELHHDEKTKQSEPVNKENEEVILIDWDAIFEGLNLRTADNLLISQDRFRQRYRTLAYNMELFWMNVIGRTTPEHSLQLIDACLNGGISSYSGLSGFFDSIPQSWKQKASYKKHWPKMLLQIGDHYAFQLHSRSVFNSFCRQLKLTNEEIVILKEGIFTRFSQSSEVNQAEVFFDFVALACTLTRPDQKAPLLQFALERFEVHMEADFGDGPWADWLYPDGDLTNQLAGWLWAELGAPAMPDRWRAAHAVSWLPLAGASDIFDALICCLQKDGAGAFISKDFIFYPLHARLYFQIACTKIAANQPEFLRKYLKNFLESAVEPHALIQKLSAQIIETLELDIPGSIGAADLQKIRAAVTSPFAGIRGNYNYTVDSYWHREHTAPPDSEFFFGIDFPPYWYAPLGRLFGVKQDQICDLAKLVIFDQWKMGNLNGHQMEPRRGLRNSNDEQQKTWHDHGSYPEIDTLDFYQSYHAMFVVAANLLQKMPLLYREEYDSDDEKWDYWLKQHGLTFDNGDWIADFRGGVPASRPKWVHATRQPNWKPALTKSNLLEQLCTFRNGAPWLYIHGGWHEIEETQKETCQVATAFVNPDTSNALLNALTTCTDPYDYKIPYYEEEHHDIDFGKFVLKGWLHTPNLDKGIDQYDPEAAKIPVPSSQIGVKFREALGLISTNAGRSWLKAGQNEPSIVAELYSSNIPHYARDEPHQTGDRICASLDFLREACRQLDFDLVIKIHVERKYTYRSSDDLEKSVEKFKIFLLTADGKIRDTKRSYHLR